MGRQSRLKKFRRRTPESQRPQTVQTREEAIVAWLTGGCVPIDHCFLAKDRFCIWSPERRDLLLVTIFDGDPALHEACREYLRQRGAAFPTVEAARAEVVRRRLLGAGNAESVKE